MSGIERGFPCLSGKHVSGFAISHAPMFLSLILRCTDVNNHIAMGVVCSQDYPQGGMWAREEQGGAKPLNPLQVYYFSSGITVGNL